MASLWNRTPIWTDWILASIAAIVVFNLNVTKSGDPLSGVGLSPGPTSAGISDGARTMFYGSMSVGALMLTAAGLVVMASGRNRNLGGLLVRTYAGVALAGFGGLLLDYRDGPVRTVQLFVYLMLFLGAVRLARAAALAADDDDNNNNKIQAMVDPGTVDKTATTGH